jgi:hypothetical protein
VPKVATIQGNFTGGEISSLLFGRTDADRYKMGLDTCLNQTVTLQGGLTRRPGTKFVAATKTPSDKARLIPFIFSSTQAYMLEFGDFYIRFYANHGQIQLSGSPYEIASPYAIADVGDISFTQSDDVLYLVHGNYPPQKLLRFGNTNWILSQIDIQDGPYGNITFATVTSSDTTRTYLTASKAITGVVDGTGAPTPAGNIQITCTAHGFSTGDRVMIRDVQGSTAANGYLITITVANANLFYFPGTIGAGTYVSGGSVNKFVGFDVGSQNNQLILSAGSGDITVTVDSQSISGAVNNGSGLIRITTTANHFFVTGNRVVITSVAGTVEANGSWIITKISDTQFDLQGSVFVNPYTSGGQVRISTFAAGDIGRPIRFRDNVTATTANPSGYNWVWVSIITYINEYTVTARVRSKEGITQLTGLPFRLGTWSATTGYPTRAVFHEDRLCMSGASGTPQRIDMSNSGDYENFAPSDQDGNIPANRAVAATLSSNEVNQIQWMTSDERGLPIGTTSGEWVVRPSTLSEAITPTNVSAKKVSAFGSSNKNAVLVGKSSIYVQAGTKKLRELSYFYNIDGFRSTDVTLLAEHITGEGIVTHPTLQKTPQPIVWNARSDGALLGMTFDRDLDNLKAGWHRHELGGFGDNDKGIPVVESVAVIPNQDGTVDDLWLIVKRYINGQTVRYVEYLTKIFESFDKQQDAYFVDCGSSYDAPKTITTITKGIATTVTAAAHGFSNGDEVVIRDVSGMTEVNGNVYKISNVFTNSFEINDLSGNPIDSTNFNNFVFPSGTVRKRVSTITGLTWLEGETVSVLGDGAVQPDQVVTGGAITLAFKAATVQVGYGYNSDIKLLRIDAGAANGTAVGKFRRIHEVGLMLQRSLGIQMGMSFDKLDIIPFRTTTDLMTHAPALFTGIIKNRIEATYDTENQICIRQNQPLPLTLLAVMPMMEVQDQG